MSKESRDDAPSPRLLRVKAFPSGESAWRLDWFGDLSYPQRFTRSNQPSVTVWLSPVVDPGWDETVDALISPGLTAHRQRISRKVALGTLVILRIGDLWRDQELVARPRYEVEQFQDVDVVGDRVTIIKAGSSLEDGSYVLPAADHPWHMAATHSYCAQVALDGGRFLVVPALELARFYFGTSSALLTRLFSPEFSKESLCVADSFTYEHGGIADISLAPGIPAASAHDVARLVFGRKTLARASLLSRSCVKASSAHEPVFPQCVFPFVGKTNLKVKGKWLPRAGEPRKTFVAYEILSCSHPFPYRALTYRVALPGLAGLLWRNELMDVFEQLTGREPPKSASAERLRQKIAASSTDNAVRAIVMRRLQDTQRLVAWEAAQPRRPVCNIRFAGSLRY